MYDLRKVPEDFPWAEGPKGHNPFADLPAGWGNIVRDELEYLGGFLEEYQSTENFVFVGAGVVGGLLRIVWVPASGKMKVFISDYIEDEMERLAKCSAKTCARCGSPVSPRDSQEDDPVCCPACSWELERQAQLTQEERDALDAEWREYLCAR